MIKGQLTFPKYSFTTEACIYANSKFIYSCEGMSLSRLISFLECSSVSQFVKFKFMHPAFAYVLLSSHWGQTDNNKQQPNFPAILAFIMPGPDSLSNSLSFSFQTLRQDVCWCPGGGLWWRCGERGRRRRAGQKKINSVSVWSFLKDFQRKTLLSGW